MKRSAIWFGRAYHAYAAGLLLNGVGSTLGVFIGGNDMGTANQSYLYCAAYGNGNFIVRGFGPAPFALNGGHGEANAAVHKAAAAGSPVSQDIAVSVTSTCFCSLLVPAKSN